MIKNKNLKILTLRLEIWDQLVQGVKKGKGNSTEAQERLRAAEFDTRQRIRSLHRATHDIAVSLHSKASSRWIKDLHS